MEHDMPKLPDSIQRRALAPRCLVFVCLLWILGPVLAAEPASDEGFPTLNGDIAQLSDFRGQVVVFNLWAVWCSPCIIEIPHLVQLQSELEALNATVIGLAVDSGDAAAIRRFWTHRLEIEPVYPLWMGTVAEATKWFGARTYPTTLIIDREGRVREHLLGLQTREDLLAAVEPYL
jgi:thiol-disulfide isomerase/thioredoxin